MSTCVTHKKIYPTESMAEEALVSAWIKYDYVHGNGPVGIYRCEECGAFHLTSKGKMNEKLSTLLASGEIQKEKEADKWLSKLKRGR
jgi:hypothetical protein